MKKTTVPLPCRNSFFQLFGQHMFAPTLWEEERKRMKKDIVSLSAEIIDWKEKLENKKQRMDHALKLANQALAYRPPPQIYSLYLKEKFLLFQLMLTLKDIKEKFKSAQEFYGLY